jgi:hypothetical protein
MYVCAYVFMYVCKYACMCVCMCVCIYIYMYVRIYATSHLCLYLCALKCVKMYVLRMDLIMFSAHKVALRHRHNTSTHTHPHCYHNRSRAHENITSNKRTSIRKPSSPHATFSCIHTYIYTGIRIRPQRNGTKRFPTCTLQHGRSRACKKTRPFAHRSIWPVKFRAISTTESHEELCARFEERQHA